MAVTRTANTVHMTAENDELVGEFKITAIVWAGCTTAAHICAIEDKAGAGNLLFKATGTGSGATVVLAPICILTDPTGFKVIDLDSGYVTLYIE